MSGEKTCQVECLIPLERHKAFELVVDHTGSWWESVFSFGETEVRESGIEPHAGGACYEIDTKGRRRVWGTVLSIEEPLYVRLAWQVSQNGEPIADPATASRVVMSFRDAGEATRLELVHGEFVRHGESADTCYERVSSDGGWRRRLQRLVDAAGAVVGR